MKRKAMITNFMIVVIGNFLYALTVKLFLQPTGLITGGTMGLALTANHFFGADINTFVLMFNLIMLAVAFVALGPSFALTTIASSLLYPFFMEVIDRTLGQPILTNDLMLNAVFCGIGIGASLGIVIRSGASTGGCDIPSIILSRKFRIPLGIIVYGMDMGILCLQMTFSDIEQILYGIFMAIIYTVVMDEVLMFGTERIEVKIISENAEEISEAIQTRLDRGVTFLHAEGGYSHAPKKIIMSIVSKREVSKVEQIAHEFDPCCFMVINQVNEVHGRGFSLSKDHPRC